jgi:preprotein translocase subunit SecG
MYYLLIGLIIIAALLLCVVVMIQNSKGGGLASSFASSNQIMGVRKTTDFIEKATWSLAGFMVVISVACAYALPSVSTESSVIMEQAVKESATNPLNAPAGFVAPTATETPAEAPATEEAPAQ